MPLNEQANGSQARAWAPGKKIAIVGAGGFAREALTLIADCGAGADVVGFFESDSVWTARTVASLDVMPLSQIGPDLQVVIAVGDPRSRQALAEGLAKETVFPVFVHPSAVVSQSVELGDGTLVCAGSILTCDIVVGRHVHFNLVTTVGHDCRIGDFVTTAPAVNISGKCTIGRGAYFGTNSCVREGLEIAEFVAVGMGGVVVSKLLQPGGTYIGNPARLMVRK
jgi:sugar O-acyltransferase (sialic acid O-acetyltransferase NeuD family)